MSGFPEQARPNLTQRIGGCSGVNLNETLFLGAERGFHRLFLSDTSPTKIYVPTERNKGGSCPAPFLPESVLLCVQPKETIHCFIISLFLPLASFLKRNRALYAHKRSCLHLLTVDGKRSTLSMTR